MTWLNKAYEGGYGMATKLAVTHEWIAEHAARGAEQRPHNNLYDARMRHHSDAVDTGLNQLTAGQSAKHETVRDAVDNVLSQRAPELPVEPQVPQTLMGRMPLRSMGVGGAAGLGAGTLAALLSGKDENGESHAGRNALLAGIPAALAAGLGHHFYAKHASKNVREQRADLAERTMASNDPRHMAARFRDYQHAMGDAARTNFNSAQGLSVRSAPTPYDQANYTRASDYLLDAAARQVDAGQRMRPRTEAVMERVPVRGPDHLRYAGPGSMHPDVPAGGLPMRGRLR